MAIASNIFVVIDPTTTNQRALQRGVAIAKATGAKLHAFLAVYLTEGDKDGTDGEMFREAKVAKNSTWLETMIQPIKDSGTEISSECIWSRHWANEAAIAAEKRGSDLIIKSTYRRSSPTRVRLKTSDWAILRTAKCPVLFAKSADALEGGKILAAVNVMAKDDAHIALNDKIIAYSKAISEPEGFELHAVNAYAGSKNFVYPADLAKRVDIPTPNAHVMDGNPASAIPATASDISAELVVIGTVARSGVAGAFIGNTAEKVLDRLETDALIITTRDSNVASQSQEEHK